MKNKNHKTETETGAVNVQPVNEENKETDQTAQFASPAAPENAAAEQVKHSRRFSPKTAAKAAARPFVWVCRKPRACVEALRNCRRSDPAKWKRGVLIALTVLIAVSVILDCLAIAFSVRARSDSDWAAAFASAAYDSAEAVRTESEANNDGMQQWRRNWEEQESIYTGNLGENLQWDINPETATLTITGVGDMDEAFGETVRPAFSMLFRGFVRKLVVCDKVTSIAPYAFENFTELETVMLGEELETIGEHAFENCAALNSVELENTSVREIGESAFADCPEITALHLPETFAVYNRFCSNNKAKLSVPAGNRFFSSDDDGALYTDDRKTLLYCPYEYDSCSGGSNNYTIPDGVEELERGCMSGCIFNRLTVPGSIKNVYLEDTGLYSAQRLVLNEGVEQLRLRKNLTVEPDTDANLWIETADLPDTLTYIQESVCCKIKHQKFSADSKLLKLDAEGSVYSADGKTLLMIAFKDGRTSYTVRDGVERIGNGATRDLCLDAGTVTFPKTLKSIGNDNFCCLTIREGKALTLPEGLEKIGDNCFQYLTVEKITIPSSVKVIGGFMLYGSDNNRYRNSQVVKKDLVVVYNGSDSQFSELYNCTFSEDIVMEYAD